MKFSVVVLVNTYGKSGTVFIQSIGTDSHEPLVQKHFDPHQPHFYKVKLGFRGVDIIFLISTKNLHCGYSLEPPQRGGSNEYPQSMFRAEKYQSFFFYLKMISLGR